MKFTEHPFEKSPKDETLSVRLTEAAMEALKALAEVHDKKGGGVIAQMIIEAELMRLGEAGELPAAIQKKYFGRKT